MVIKSEKKNSPIWYWVIPIGLFIFQIVYSLNSLNQIRFEELAEVIRMPFFWHYRYAYNGIATSVSWYSALVVIYNIFGFQLFAGKYLKLLLHLISLIALALLLKKYFGYKKATLPLLAFGLSPTIFYYNMLGLVYAIDLNLFPIYLLLLSRINFKSKTLFDLSTLGSFLLLSIGWLSYPTFIFYLPPLIFFYTFFLFKNQKSWSIRIKKLVTNLLVFILPIAILFLYIKNSYLFIYDPRFHSGLFRGGGVLKFSEQLFINNLGYLAENLFIIGNGYYYELIQVEFSLIFPILTVLLVILLSAKIILSKFRLNDKISLFKIPIILCFLVMIFNIVIVNFTDVLTPGLRRYTPSLGAFYTLYTLSWVYLMVQKISPKVKLILISVFLFLPTHHILVYPQNLSYLRQPSFFATYKDAVVFNYPDSPDKFISKMVEKAQKEDINLICRDQNKQPMECRYVEIYSAIAGTCLWNHLSCHNIYGYDVRTQKYILLNLDFWQSNYFAL